MATSMNGTIISDFPPESDLLIQPSRYAFPARPEPALVFAGRWLPAADAAASASLGKTALVRARLGARRAV
jgi:hypothetical protein